MWSQIPMAWVVQLETPVRRTELKQSEEQDFRRRGLFGGVCGGSGCREVGGGALAEEGRHITDKCKDTHYSVKSLGRSLALN